LVVNKEKGKRKQILLINASKLFEKGRPKNFLPEEAIEKVHKLYSQWKEEEGISKVVDKVEVVRNDYNLSPSRYVADNHKEEVLPLEEAVTLLKTAEEKRDSKSRNLPGPKCYLIESKYDVSGYA